MDLNKKMTPSAIIQTQQLWYYKTLQLLSLWMGTVTSVLNNESLQAALQDKKLQALLYQELKIIARAKLNKHAQFNDLDTTALVHEAFLKLNGQSEDKQWSNRRHFYATAALAMRHILVDQARRQLTEKRGSQPITTTLSNLSADAKQDYQELVALNDALEQLSQVDGRLVELVHLRFFVGLSMTESADIMDVSKRTLDREWNKAKALLATWMA
jgi:RNA polymerase sigma factor (TIGR02999 family)